MYTVKWGDLGHFCLFFNDFRKKREIFIVDMIWIYANAHDEQIAYAKHIKMRVSEQK